MERRTFIKKAALGTTGAGLLAGCVREQSGPAIQALPRLRWRLASSYPPSLDTIYGASERFAERVKQLTDGRFEIFVYAPGELVPGLQVMDAVQQGTVEVGHSASYYFIGKNPALAFDTCVPFGLTARQQLAWLYHGGGLEVLREVFSDFNILNFPGGNTGVQMGGWFRRPVETLADLKGLKMRIPGEGGKVMSKLGVTVQVLAGGEIFPALERGVIDATEWVGPYDDEKLGFYKVAKNYYYPGWWEPGPSLVFYVNQGAWDKLPATYKAAVETATAESCYDMQARYDSKNPAALQRLLGQGVQLKPFSNEIMTAAHQAQNEMAQALVSSNASYKKVYESWAPFREASFKWFGTAERAYADFAFPKV